MQKARRHPSPGLRRHGTPTACRRTVSGSVSPRYPRYFSPFPHGTGPLSVSQEYLALPDGAGKFNRDFSGPGLLRIPASLDTLPLRDSHPLRSAFPYSSGRLSFGSRGSYYPVHAVTCTVWAAPLSLAATHGITVVFSSSGYLDVSVPRVCLPINRDSRHKREGCPIRISADQFVCADPRGFSQLATSFFASESLGIPRAPLST